MRSGEKAMAEKKDEGKKKKAKKHLREIRTTAAGDGSYVHHHTYVGSPEDAMTEPERSNMATSSSPDEAGQHVAEQFAMNQSGAGGGQPEEEEEPAQAGA
jgi:hypothetical protein